MQRDETHYMFGQGRATILSINVTSVDFDHPSANLNSRGLAWAVLSNYFPSAMSVRLGPTSATSAGPIAGCPMWMPATLLSLAALARVVVVMRRVPAGHCKRCRYDLSSATTQEDGTAICPECGMIQLLNDERLAWYRGWL